MTLGPRPVKVDTTRADIYNGSMNTLPREKTVSQDTNAARNLVIALLLLSLMLILAACGGGAETAGETAAPDDAASEDVAAIVVPTAETTAPTAESPDEAAPEPTDIPPTAEPPTAEPEPTEAPTEEPPAEADDDSQLLALPDGLCANPFFPVIEGRTYTYQTEVPEFGVSTYSFSFTNVTPTSFDWVLGSEGQDVVTYTWQCTEEGLLSPNIQLNTGINVDIELLESSGITFPVPDNVSVGSTWTTRYVTRTTIGDTGLGAIETNQTVEVVSEIVAVEPVSVPYGDFDEAIKVQTTGTMEMANMLNGEALPATTFDFASNTWYVEGIGQVRSEDLSDFMGTGEVTPTVTELVSIE